MSVILYEPGLFELLESPTGPTTRNVTAKAEAVAAVARENVRTNFNTRTGTLHDSIGIFPEETVDGVAYEVGTEGAPYGRILELGGEPHEIYAVNRRRLFSEPDNPTPLNNIMLQVVSHPGPPAKPWLVPALELVFNGG
jgi:hypothetical protein